MAPAPTLSTRRDQHATYAAAHGLASAEWTALGTTVHLLVTDPAALPAARTAVTGVLAAIDQAASRFRPDSELSRLATGSGGWTAISPLFAQALRVALNAAAWTGGLVDPTVGGTLIDLGYDRSFRLVAPEAPGARLTIRQLPGWRDVELDDAALRVRVPAGMRLDLGATAKGLAADLAADAALQAGGCGVLVGLGGDLSVSGPAPAEGWPVALTDVTDFDAPAEDGPTVAIRAGGLATSSIRARRWRRGGSELHHIVDPRSCRPAVAPFHTVSVTAVTATLANAASTAAVILGLEAPAWLEERGVPARLVARDGSSRCTAGWPAPGGPV